MRIKLDRKGYENFTGLMGSVKFENGVSEDISLPDAKRIAASIRCVFLDSGEQAGPAQDLINAQSVKAPQVSHQIADREKQDAEESRKQGSDDQEDEVQEEVLDSQDSEEPAWDSEVKIYTREELEAIADDKGLDGLRVIASEYNIVGRKISTMIQDIINAQAKRQAS